MNKKNLVILGGIATIGAIGLYFISQQNNNNQIGGTGAGGGVKKETSDPGFMLFQSEEPVLPEGESSPGYNIMLPEDPFANMVFKTQEEPETIEFSPIEEDEKLILQNIGWFQNPASKKASSTTLGYVAEQGLTEVPSISGNEPLIYETQEGTIIEESIGGKPASEWIKSQDPDYYKPGTKKEGKTSIQEDKYFDVPF